MVWENGGMEYNKGWSGYTSMSTIAGKYYGGHCNSNGICTNGDNFPLCGDWA